MRWRNEMSRNRSIPKVRQQVFVDDDDDAVIIKPEKCVRLGWDAAFKEMQESKDDENLIDDEIVTEWENEEWEW